MDSFSLDAIVLPNVNPIVSSDVEAEFRDMKARNAKAKGSSHGELGTLGVAWRMLWTLTEALTEGKDEVLCSSVPR